MAAGASRAAYCCSVRNANPDRRPHRWPFAPMHQRDVLAEGGGTFSDDMHIILSGIDGLLVMIAFVVGAIAFRGWFRFTRSPPSCSSS